MRLFLIILVKERITMVKVTLKGGAVKEYDDNVTVAEIAKSLGGGLYKAACAGKLNGRVVDLRTPVTEDS